MTFKEKLAIEHPDKVDHRCEGGCMGCPSEYGYENESCRPCASEVVSCTDCWKREIPGTEPDKATADMVNHPPHYQSKSGLEAIDVIEAFTADLMGIEATDTGNVLKYMLRWKGKNGLEDLKKARWYLDHLINHVEKLQEGN